MAFASPLWLLGLVPWAGVVIWLLLGRRRRVGVPFIKLWRGTSELPRAKPSLARPPLPVLLAILAMLLAVLASARPIVHARTGVPITIIVDRGITMSARGKHSERFKEICDELAVRLNESMGDGPVQVISVPGEKMMELDRANWAPAVAAMGPTIQKTGAELDALVGRTLAEGAGNLIVVSDQALPTNNGVVQIEPDTAVSNLGITNVAARAVPRAQVMVVLRDQGSPTPIRTATLHLASDSHLATQDVQVARDGTATAFIDLPGLGPIVSIDVDAPDDLAADNHAWLAREEAAANIEDSANLPEPLRRMIAVYRRHRESGGKRVKIVADARDAMDEPSVVIPPEADSILPTDELHVESHPVSANVDWSVARHSTGALAPVGYRAIVSAGDEAFVAVRDQPARSVWVSVNSPDWASKADYVIFWTNVFDWLGGEDVYRWHPVGDREKPGVENGSDGTVRAYNAIDVEFPAIRPNDWGRLRELNQRSTSGIDLTGVACLIGMMSMILASLAMRRQNVPAIPAGPPIGS